MICYRDGGLIVWKILESEDELASMLGNYPETIRSCKNKSHRLQSLASAIIAKDIFQDEISHRENGKPYLRKSQVNISISNTGQYVALLYGNGRVGVDIELISRNASKVIGRVSDSAEIEMVKRLYPKNPEIFLWCLKEAAFKMLDNQPEGMALEYQKLLSVDNESKKAVMRTLEGDFTLSYTEVENLLVIFS